MSRIVFLNDLHIGYSGAAQLYQDEIKAFLSDSLFPYIDSNDVSAVVIAGDFFDDRRVTNVRVASEIARESLLDELEKRSIPVHITVGNHDTYYRNRIVPNSVSQFDDEYENVTVWLDPTDVTIDGVSFLMLPWVCESNRAAVEKAIENTSSPYCVAHLELIGFDMGAGQVSRHGQDSSDYAGFRKVLTGHYHTRSEQDNILYMGAQYQMTRADDGVSKGFYVMNTADESLERIINPRQLFVSLLVDADEIEETAAHEWTETNLSSLDGKIVTVKFSDSCTSDCADRVCRILEKSSVYDYKIVDSLSRAVESGDLESEIEVGDTVTLMHSAIDKDDVYEGMNRDLLKTIVSAVHTEAIGGTSAEH